jgi:hypothetical protein
LVTARERWHQD